MKYQKESLRTSPIPKGNFENTPTFFGQPCPDPTLRFYGLNRDSWLNHPDQSETP